ncbi:polysaccharide biosynthesis protein [Pseudomaricurvus alkylphenolicus]|jgi:FlaA1/EpsC-like NDP-sugar epimerase|uniref:polysaccharide biosynthesis protein n=1 Tax=Pseudomaricurvus alkylphenolicus TaxID=1306991 RepID=UPI00141F4D18|nr:nucleoside-diphosphate sugar epimerase/dehydratase [Pseudomaricurvus alkylphenolicus]NIB42104.1 polysaccharide biosynthesis protein [Pseudomaricurvus alkylphenolicus]
MILKHNLLQPLLEAARPTKRLVSVAYDVIGLCLAAYLAWALRIGEPWISPTQTDLTCLLLTISVSIGAFIRLGLYRAILRYMAHDAAFSVFIGLLISTATLATSAQLLGSSMPTSVPLIYLLTAMFFIGLPRIMVRNVVQLLFPLGDTKVIIYGAGSAGRLLADSLRQSKDYQPIAFIDDDRRLQGSQIRGLQVYASSDLEELIVSHQASNIFLALGKVERANRLHIVRQLEKYPVQIQTIPPLEALTRGQANIEEVRDIQIEDILGRDPVQPDGELMQANIRDKVVMVTGAGGSIGSELCRQIIQFQPRALILFELNEHNLYQIENELQAHVQNEQLDLRLIALLGSVQDQGRLVSAMKRFNVQTVYHAAAYKHVPLIEHNMIEGVRNNVFGTLHCARAAQITSVETFVLISTDKAVRSTNIMGASKRLAELVLKSVADNSRTTRFCMVRFGNVLGSSGSVVPRFREQIAQGGPVTVTHPEITRYFMTIPEAAQLVIQAGALAQGGETYVLEMGEPVKITDMAREMIQLSGYTVRTAELPEGDIEIAYTGLRPGEKLYEELLIDNNVVGTKHPRITEALDPSIGQEQVTELIDALSLACHEWDCQAVQAILKKTPTAYSGSGHINDLVYQPVKPQPLRVVTPAKTV